MKKFLKSFRYGEKGFTLIELLIVIAVLAALAAVVVPAVNAFLNSAKLTAANTEANNLRTAAMSYLADYGDFPANSDPLEAGDYLSGDLAYGSIYTFDTSGGGSGTGIILTSPNPTYDWMGWDCTKQSWVKGAAVACP